MDMNNPIVQSGIIENGVLLSCREIFIPIFFTTFITDDLRKYQSSKITYVVCAYVCVCVSVCVLDVHKCWSVWVCVFCPRSIQQPIVQLCKHVNIITPDAAWGHVFVMWTTNVSPSRQLCGRRQDIVRQGRAHIFTLFVLHSEVSSWSLCSISCSEVETLMCVHCIYFDQTNLIQYITEK